MTLTMTSRLGLLALAACVSCDAALSYTLPGARTVQGADPRAPRYVVDVAEGVEARFHASTFTTDGRTEVQVMNSSPSAVTFRATPTLLKDSRGGSLRADCQLPREETTVLAKGQSISIVCRFEARLRTMGFWYEPEFKSLTLEQPGFSQDGHALTVVAEMHGF
jgi:hypothetical protein